MVSDTQIERRMFDLVAQTSTICYDLQALERTLQLEASMTRDVLEHGLAQVDYELQQGFSLLGQTMHEGFVRTLEELAVIRMTSSELVAIARTPAHTAALEHYATANDWYQRGLLPEALEELDRAITGVTGVSAGYKTDWRFHALRGLIYLGSGARHDAAIVNPQWGYQCFEYALRYLDPSDVERKSAFLTCCGHAKVLLRSDSADNEAMRLFLCAIQFNERNVEARLEFARVAARRGQHTEGLLHLQAGCHYDFRAYSIAESDPQFALYRDHLAQKKSVHIRELQQSLPSLCVQLVESTTIAEQHMALVGETCRLQPDSDLTFRRYRRSATLRGLFGIGLLALSVGSCAFVVKGNVLNISAGDVVLAILLTPPVAAVAGVLTLISSEGGKAKGELVAARLAASERIKYRIATARSVAEDRIGVAVSAARGWLDAVSKLAILGVENVHDRHRGAAACQLLHQLAERVPPTA